MISDSILLYFLFQMYISKSRFIQAILAEKRGSLRCIVFSKISYIKKILLE